RLRRQAGSVQVPFEPLRVDRIAAADEGFDVDAGGRRWQARMVMIATGLRDRLPGPWGEEALACGALRLCPTCDAFEASGAHRGDGETLEPDTVYSFLGFTTSVPTDGLDLRRTDGGEILVDRHQQTRTPGLYAIGDVVGGLNQIAVAVGQAAAAATHAHGQLP